MKPVDQTDLTSESGNCYSACIASILELPLSEVPCYHGDGWLQSYNLWLRPYGFALVSMQLPEDIEETPEIWAHHMPGYCILAGDSPRWDCLHAVVAFDGQIVHDPHPQREMGLGKWRECDFLCPIDAHKMLPPAPEQVAKFASTWEPGISNRGMHQRFHQDLEALLRHR